MLDSRLRHGRVNQQMDSGRQTGTSLNETLRVVCWRTDGVAGGFEIVLCNGMLFMPAGDAQRAWFPEMVERLRVRWQQSMSMPELIELRGQLDSMLQSIRSERQILPPLMYCRHCKTQHRAASPRVSVRALILALSRFEIASPDETRELEKSWKRYRQSEQLDLYGLPVAMSASQTAHQAPGHSSEPAPECSTAPPGTV